MFRHNRLAILLLVLAIGILPGCGDTASGDRGCLSGVNCGAVIVDASSSIFSGSSVLQPTSTTNSGTISCSVDAPSVVAAGQNTTLTVRASGGAVRSGQTQVEYYITSMPQYGYFYAAAGSVAQLVATGSYNNNNTDGSNVIASRQFYVADRVGNTGTCNFSITVQPANYSGSIPANNSACYLTTSTPNPRINVPFNLTVSASSYPTTIKAIQFQWNWGVNFNSTLNAATTFSTTYLTPGPRTITALVASSSGQLYTCSTAVNVLSQIPRIEVSTQPGNTLSVGSTITVTANASGFSGTPTYDFTTTESGIRIVKNGNKADVTAIDGKPHNFTVIASATSGGDSANAQVPVAFQGGSTVNAYCLLQAASGSLTPNGQVSVSVISIDGNGNTLSQAVELTQVSVSGGTVSSGLANPVLVKFPTAGTYTIGVRAVLQSSGLPCNGGGLMQEAITIQ